MTEEFRKVLNCPYCLRHQSMKLQRSRNSFHHRYKCDNCGTMVLVPKEEKK